METRTSLAREERSGRGWDGVRGRQNSTDGSSYPDVNQEAALQARSFTHEGGFSPTGSSIEAPWSAIVTSFSTLGAVNGDRFECGGSTTRRRRVCRSSRNWGGSPDTRVSPLRPLFLRCELESFRVLRHPRESVHGDHHGDHVFKSNREDLFRKIRMLLRNDDSFVEM